MKSKSLRKIAVGIFLIVGMSGVLIYSIFFFIPEFRLSKVLSEFEKAARNKNFKKLHFILSKNSPLYERLDTEKLQFKFNKFEKGIIVRDARLIPLAEIDGSRSNIIWGYSKMKAKSDSDYRLFSDITLVKEDGIWKIRQFGFPSFLDY